MLAKRLKRPAMAVWLELVANIVAEAPITLDAAFERGCVAMGVEATHYQTERFRRVVDLLETRCKIVVERQAGQPVLLKNI